MLVHHVQILVLELVYGVAIDPGPELLTILRTSAFVEVMQVVSGCVKTQLFRKA
jgi:hypothetical protein